MDKLKTGLVGCGKICDIYLKNSKNFNNIEIVACSDLIKEAAQAKAAQYNIKAYTNDELFADSEIKIVINLTVPKAHADVALAALKAGKHVYNEKPLAVTREDAKKMVKLAKSKNFLIGCAPDTFLGAGLQTCRKLIDDGAVGTPVAATAFMMGHGPEGWHPNPEFFYKFGAGPMFDVGPYYITALINMLGPVESVTGMTKISFPERTITAPAKLGQKIKVEVPTYIVGVMNFKSGAIGTIITSFDVWSSRVPRIEIYGSESTLVVPDPNIFGGPILLYQRETKEWKEMPFTHSNDKNSRCLGVADMASSIISGRKHRASSDLAYHVLDIMHTIHEASDQKVHLKLKSVCDRPAPIPAGLAEWQID